MFFKIFLLFTVCFSILEADILKPAYLEVIQKTNDTYGILLKIPVKKNTKPLIMLKPIEGCKEKREPIVSHVNDAYMKRVDLVCEDKGLKGKRIELQGLEKTEMNLLLRLEFLDNGSQSVILKGTENSYLIEEDASSLQIIKTYTWLGITHILMGFDHLLFVFSLLLIVKSVRRLLWTISAFTLAHSITMAGATLGFVHVPQQPVEAIIALSILFLAMEIIHEKRGKIGLTAKYPWIIAFTFGLLHGFGFAGALAEIGLPQQAISLALIFFNIGVELGQLMFVATVLLVVVALQRVIEERFMKKIEMIGVYVIGSVAAFWMIERVLAF